MDKISFLNVFISNSDKNPDVILPNGATVPADKFFEIFEAVETVNYNNLMVIDNNELGYKDFFDQCKAEGIFVSLSE